MLDISILYVGVLLHLCLLFLEYLELYVRLVNLPAYGLHHLQVLRHRSLHQSDNYWHLRVLIFIVIKKYQMSIDIIF